MDFRRYSPDARRNIGNLLVMLLARAGCGAHQVAREIGVRPEAVNQWRRRVTPPTPKNCDALVKLTGRYLSDLLIFIVGALGADTGDRGDDAEALALARAGVMKRSTATAQLLAELMRETVGTGTPNADRLESEQRSRMLLEKLVVEPVQKRKEQTAKKA